MQIYFFGTVLFFTSTHLRLSHFIRLNQHLTSHQRFFHHKLNSCHLEMVSPSSTFRVFDIVEFLESVQEFMWIKEMRKNKSFSNCNFCLNIEMFIEIVMLVVVFWFFNSYLLLNPSRIFFLWHC